MIQQDLIVIHGHKADVGSCHPPESTLFILPPL